MTLPGGAWSSAAARPAPTATPSAMPTPGRCRSATRPPGAGSRPKAPAPEPRRSPGSAIRASGSTVQLLVSGGLNAENGEHFNDVWALTLSGDDASWSRLAESACSSTSAPACRRSAAAVYDERRDRLLLAFGRDAERFYADTWSFSMSDERWHALGSAP